MNRILSLAIIFGCSILIISVSSLYTINISSRNAQASFPFMSSINNLPNGYLSNIQLTDHIVNSTSDLCSPEFAVYRGGYGSLSSMPCLEQINLKLDKLISLEEKEKTP